MAEIKAKVIDTVAELGGSAAGAVVGAAIGTAVAGPLGTVMPFGKISEQFLKAWIASFVPALDQV